MIFLVWRKGGRILWTKKPWDDDYVVTWKLTSK